MIKGLRLIKKHLIISIIISIGLGTFLGNQLDLSWLSNVILPLTFFLVYPMLVPLKFNTLKQKINIKLQLTTQLVNFVVFPVIAFGIGLLFLKMNHICDWDYY